MEILSNELSFSHKAEHPHDARSFMRVLIDLVRALHREGFELTLRISRGMKMLDLAASYPLSKWLNDAEVNRDEREFFRRVATRSPYLEEILPVVQQNLGEEFVCEFGDQAAIGLSVAYVLGSPVISYPSSALFSKDPIFVKITSMREDQIMVFDQPICNLASIQAFRARKDYLVNLIMREREVTSGPELLQKSPSRFPRLIFCEKAVSLIEELNGKESYFKQILRHLDCLQESLSIWSVGSFSPSCVGWSNESESTLNNSRLKKLREFRCPDGLIRLMASQTKINGANIRIHYLPIDISKECYIGYIGPHLPTTLYS